MSKIINYDTNNIRVVRDDNNITFYSKANLKVEGKNGYVVLYDGTNTVENLLWSDITVPLYLTFDEYVVAVQGYIDEYAPPFVGTVGDSYDAFSRLRTSATGTRLDVEFTFNINEEILDEVTNGSSTIAHQSNTRDVLLSVVATGTGDNAALYSYPVPYTAGNSQLIFITGVLDKASIGGGTAQIFLRSKVTGSIVEQVVDQSSWDTPNNDLDWTKSQIFGMDFQSLKVGRIRYYLDRCGFLEKVHEITNDNVRQSGYWQTPSLPVYWRIYNDATYTYMEIGYGDTDNAIGFRYRIAKSASATMVAICATVKSEGGDNLNEMTGYPTVIDMGVTPKTVSTSLIPLLSIRQRSTFNSINNNSIALIQSISVQTNNPIKLIALHDSALTGASWANVDTDHSTMEYDITASAYSNGHIIATEYVATSKNISSAYKSLLEKVVLWYRKNGNSGILTIAAVRSDSTNASVLVSCSWREIR